MVSKNHYSDLNQASLGLGFTVSGSAGLLLFGVGEGFPSNSPSYGGAELSLLYQLLSIRKLFLF